MLLYCGMDLSGKTILVTGASGALGSELTNVLSSKGANVLGTATNNDSAGLIPAKAEVRLLLDFQEPDSIQTLTDYLVAASQIDGIINASGVVAFGPVSELTVETTKRLNAVNSQGPIQLISQLFGKLKESSEAGNQPFVLNITGVVAETPMMGIAAYCGSKTAVHGFLTALGKEWRREGIRVISARPGHTETGLASRAIAGQAPTFPAGMTTEHVVARLVAAIEADEKDLASSDF